MGRRCPKCQQIIIGSGRLFNGKLYCDQCYKIASDEAQNFENEKRSLFEFIKELFAIDELPDSWVVTIDQLVSSGKTLAGIRMTLTYYYTILGNTPNMVYGLSIVKKYYEETRQYAIKQQEIMQKNMEHEDKAETVTVKITRPVSTRKKPNYRIEDL